MNFKGSHDFCRKKRRHEFCYQMPHTYNNDTFNTEPHYHESTINQNQHWT